MEFALWGLYWLLIAFALLGCFIHKFPGPVLAFAAVLLAKLCMNVGAYIEWWNVILIGVLVIVAWFVNRQLPKWTAGLGTYGKGAKWGSIVGSILGLILLPAIASGFENPGVTITITIVTLILTTFIFAFGLEFLNIKDVKAASKNGGIATFEYTCSSLIKLITVVYAVYLMFVNN